ncbi:MAG: dihydroorotase family protein [Candidatus Bathyarchaeia archaeon]
MIVDSVLANAKAYFKQAIVDCSIAFNEGRIFKIGRESSMPTADARFDLENHLVLPGLIDAHVHLRDEGKSYKEDFLSGTAAAAAGGMTTVLDMPNNDPVTMSAEALRNRMKIAEARILVDVGFRSEFPGDAGEIEGIVREGAVGFKLFMANQVGGLDVNDDEAMLEAFKAVGKLKVSTSVHAEDEQMLKRGEGELQRRRQNDVAAFLKAHSENVELRAATRVLDMVKQGNFPVHFCHVSTQNGLRAIAAGKKSGMLISCEVTPHHLLLTADDLKRAGTLGVTMPPVREKQHAEALWEGVRNGWVDIVASDHAPHTIGEKEADTVWDVKVGIPGLETTLPLLLTQVKRGRMSIGDVARLMSEKPAEIFNLKGKGYLREGNNADLTVVDLRKKFRIDSSNFLSKAKFSPFDGREVEGKPAKTFVGGRLIMDEGEIIAKAGSGRVIRRQ